MESGRATPEAMKRPTQRPQSVSELSLPADRTSSARLEEQVSPPTPPESVEQPTSRPRPADGPRYYYGSTTPQSGQTEKLEQNCSRQDQFLTWVGNFAAVQGCVLTGFGLGWAISSRILRSNLEDWTTSIEVPKPTQDTNFLPDFSNVKDRDRNISNSLPRLNTSCNPRQNDSPVAREPTRNKMSYPRPESNDASKSNRSSGTHKPDDLLATQTLLRKHFDYLMPWISSQPADDDETSEEAISSDTKIDSELCCMSIEHFTDLSTAIYRDVRRREQQPSPGDTYPQKWDQCMRNRQNEARMVLCRTINEQFHRLVLALVLEQARRLAELRVRINRKALVASRLALSPLIN